MPSKIQSIQKKSKHKIYFKNSFIWNLDIFKFIYINILFINRNIFILNKNIPFQEKYKMGAQLGLMSLEQAVDLVKSRKVLSDHFKFPKIRNLIKSENLN